MKRFCDLNFPTEKFKNDAQRKAFLLKKNVKLQKDEHGVEGVAVAKEGDAKPGEEKEIKIGKRMSADKIRREDYGDGVDTRDQRDTSHQRMLNALVVHGNSQARPGHVSNCCLFCVLTWNDMTLGHFLSRRNSMPSVEPMEVVMGALAAMMTRNPVKLPACLASTTSLRRAQECVQGRR